MSAGDVSRSGLEEAIESVIDPCSRYNGSQLSLVELGMIDAIRINGTAVSVTLLLDDPTCMYTFLIQKELRDAIGEVAGVESVSIDVVADQIWTEERMTAEAHAKLVRHRVDRRAKLVQLSAARARATGTSPKRS
jgi:metal-sulfur cluster biosynthetic enzyme